MSTLVNLEQGEYIVTIARKHWWSIFTWLLGSIVISFLPLIFGAVFVSVFATLPDITNIVYIIGLFYTIYLALVWIMFFVEWTDYYLDVWVVTNQRIVDIEHNGLFARDVATVKLNEVEDITTDVSGILSTFLKLGTITVQTAASKNEFEFYF